MVPDAINLASVQRALVVKLRHHGDVLLSSPVFQVLKNRAAHVEVDALVYSDTHEMLEGHPAVSRMHLIDRSWKRSGLVNQARREGALISALAARRYQLIVHLTDHWRGAWLAQALRPRWSVAPARASRVWNWSFSHRYPLPPFTPRHTVETNLDALRRIGVQPGTAERKVVFVPGQAAEDRVRDLVAEPFVHMHPASRWRFKCWTPERNAALADRLSGEGHRIVFTAAPDETPLIDEIVAKMKSRPVNLAGKLSLKELGALIGRAKVFIGVDSMPMHVAAAMGVPTVALFGPSSEVVWGPWNVEQRVLTTSHSCRPCGVDGCGGSKVSECLTLLDVEPVHAAARELLAR